MSKPIKSAAPQGPQTVANDNDAAGVAEIVRNGEPINWGYWASRHTFSPEDAARLAHCIDPIRWPDEQHAQGAWSDDLRVKVRALTAWLAERRPAWTLAELVRALGDSFAPHTMKEAAGPMLDAVLAAGDAQLSEKKRQEGRYTLEEAAQVLAAETGESVDRMLKKFMAAAESGALPVYAPGKNARYLYGRGHASCVREFYEEVYWNDLNAWFEKNETRIECKFANPKDMEQTRAESAAVSIENAALSGAPAKDEPPAPMQRQRWQEREILRVISALGYRADALPIPEAGKSGIKKEVRAKLNLTTVVFDKAWERLRKQEEIKDAK